MEKEDKHTSMHMGERERDMATITSMNVLLDMRLCGKQSEGIDYVLNSIAGKLAQQQGINLYYLYDKKSTTEEFVDRMGIEPFQIMYIGDCFSDMDAYISGDVSIPEDVKKVPEITKYALVNQLLDCTYGTNNDWYEEKIRNYQNNYDYYITFSEKAKEIYLEKTVGIRADRVIVLPLRYHAGYDPTTILAKKIFTNANQYYCLAFYKKEYHQEMENLAKGFLKFLEAQDQGKCDLVFVLAYLEETDWDYKKICYLFQDHEDNLLIMDASKEEKRHRLIYEADAYLDVFHMEEVNVALLEELNYQRYIVSSNVAIEGGTVIKTGNSVYGFQCAINELNQFLHKDNAISQEKKEHPVLEQKDFTEQLFQIENRKRETPLVTVITITYNLIRAGRKESIQQCIRSVHNQTYKNLEHIIIDGASDDGTLKLLEVYRRKGWIDIFSEPDDGLYDAMNKGIRRAKGKYIAFLNSDDFYHDIYGVEKTVCALQKVQADYAFSDTNILNEDGSVYYWAADMGNLLYARHYCHQSLFMRLDVIKELNGFDLNYKVSSDSDLMIRLYEKGYSYINVSYCFVTYRGGGLSAAMAEESRKDHSQSFFIHLGNQYALTKNDCYRLWQYRFFEELSEGHQIRLMAKIPEYFNAEAVFNEYLRRKKGTQRSAFKRMIAQRVSFDSFLLSRNMRVRNGRNEMIYYFCKVVPIWITKEKQ